MNELHLAYKIRQHLNQGLRQLPPETIDRLDKAREMALARQKQAESQSVLAVAGSFIQYHFDHFGFKQLLASFALLLCVALSTFWMADQRVSELGAIDSALLTDELPINAFTDRGFDAWLKRASPR